MEPTYTYEIEIAGYTTYFQDATNDEDAILCALDEMQRSGRNPDRSRIRLVSRNPKAQRPLTADELRRMFAAYVGRDR